MTANIFRRENDVSYDFIHLVPKTRRENLEYRRDLYTRCAKDQKFRQATINACRADTLFFFNAFLWVFEPRPGMECGHGKLPFITWQPQDRAIKCMDRYWGLEDIRFWKTRGEGATWMAVMRAYKDWVFDYKWDPAAIGLVTRNEETVDSVDDPDSLMWKLDWQHKQMPSWLATKNFNRKLSEHSLRNRDNEATIIGYAASEDVGSGGRKRVFIMDELAKFGVMRRGADYAAMASTAPVTECRVIVSTPKGTANAYYDSITEAVDIDKYQVTRRVLTEQDHQDLNDKGVIVLHWTDNPLRNRGLYRCGDDGQIRPIDEQKYGPIPDEYHDNWQQIRADLEAKGFRVVDTVRSPWYDRQCLRSNATPQNIAQEQDLDFGGSGFTIFDGDTVAVAKKGCRVHLDSYEVALDPESELGYEAEHHPNGKLRMWIRLPADTKQAPEGAYAIGCDIASGLGGSTHSNSVACIIDIATGEQVGEWASNSVKPDQFTDICIALGYMFHTAKIIHEVNGPFGKTFTGQLLYRRYENIYRRRENFKYGEKALKELGWGSNQDTKADMFTSLARKLRAGMIVPRSASAVEEMKSWVMLNGRIVHAKAANTTDDSSQGEAHGDRVIALGVAAILCDVEKQKKKVSHEDDIIKKPRKNTMAYRLREYDEDIKKGASVDW